MIEEEKYLKLSEILVGLNNLVQKYPKNIPTSQVKFLVEEQNNGN